MMVENLDLTGNSDTGSKFKVLTNILAEANKDSGLNTV
jgi:hypothetical protein